jgi:hypothetical protein
VIEGDFGHAIFLKACGITDFTLAKMTGDFFRKGFVVAELVEKGFVEEVLDVFGVIEGCGGSRGLGCFALVSRLTGIDSLNGVSKLFPQLSRANAHTFEDA